MGFTIEEFDLTFDMIELAAKDAESLGKLNNSITEGEGNRAGFLGEQIVMKWCRSHGIEVERANTYDYDLICRKDGRSITVDVKTKRRNVAPQMYFDASICAKNIGQSTDRYVFAQVNPTNSGYIYGWMPKKEYFEKAIFHKKGEYDSTNDWHFRQDCYNLSYAKLYPMSSF